MRWHLCRLAMSAFGCSLAATRSHRRHGIAVSHASVSTFSWFCTPRATQSSPKLELLLTFSLPAWKPSSHRTVQLADTRDESGLRCAGDAFQDRVEKESSTDRLQQNSFWSSSGRTRHARRRHIAVEFTRTRVDVSLLFLCSIQVALLRSCTSRQNADLLGQLLK